MEEASKHLLEDESASRPRWLSRSNKHNTGLTLVLVASNLLLACGWALTIIHNPGSSDCSSLTPRPSHVEQSMIPLHIAAVPRLPKKPVQFHWNTAYSSTNDTEATELWDVINTAHGHIAVDHDWAAAHHWLPSMPVPGNETKGLYLLESYHQLHCLKIVRTLFLQSLNSQSLSYPAQHARHCFDYFRQFIMCHADNTPLYTLGQHTSGDGQWHMCNDWSALRDYATENSACFKDRVGNETLREQFGHCDGGVDGVPDDVTSRGRADGR